MNIGGVAQRRAAPPSRPDRPCTRAGRAGRASSGDERRVVVLGPDGQHVVEPAAVVGVGPALTRVLEAPRVPLVRPVRGVESVRLPPVADRAGVVAGELEVLTELEVRGGAGAGVGAVDRAGRRPRPAGARRDCPGRAPPSRAPSPRTARARFGSSAPRRGPGRCRRAGWRDRACGRNRSRGCDRGAPAPRPARWSPPRRSRRRSARSPSRTARPRRAPVDERRVRRSRASMYGLGASASTSSATVTTSRPSGVQLLAPAPATRAGQTGTLTTTPRRPGAPSGRGATTGSNASPSMVGSASSGATAVDSAFPVTAVSGPRAQIPCSSSATRGMPSRSASTRTSMRPSPVRASSRQRHADVRLARPVVLHRPAGACAPAPRDRRRARRAASADRTRGRRPVRTRCRSAPRPRRWRRGGPAASRATGRAARRASLSLPHTIDVDVVVVEHLAPAGLAAGRGRSSRRSPTAGTCRSGRR